MCEGMSNFIRVTWRRPNLLSGKSVFMLFWLAEIEQCAKRQCIGLSPFSLCYAPIYQIRCYKAKNHVAYAPFHVTWGRRLKWPHIWNPRLRLILRVARIHLPRTSETNYRPVIGRHTVMFRKKRMQACLGNLYTMYLFRQNDSVFILKLEVGTLTRGALCQLSCQFRFSLPHSASCIDTCTSACQLSRTPSVADLHSHTRMSCVLKCPAADFYRRLRMSPSLQRYVIW